MLLREKKKKEKESLLHFCDFASSVSPGGSGKGGEDKGGGAKTKFESCVLSPLACFRKHFSQ